MELQQVKSNLNKMVTYKGVKGVYRFIGCRLWKNKEGLQYSAELLDTKHGNSYVECELKNIEVEE